ncbi:malyl-CoA thiolesterase [Kiloniella litopenaei]|uniref:Malyl-CoA thiolesterase n=1 Tax=Kiloniella litopenaei TaxID=1549748 RepID=A0A0M2R5K7_9PROT|nr:CoA ester lyase [Kiloniella litopenaei]KKJ76966.1 malyl-CoA thiolesterase [Kiloniella litopenaei]
MVAAQRPRRSVLYMPGSKSRALEKARNLMADGLIFDLEDAVADDKKVEARQMVVQALSQGGYGKREIIVRVNGLDSEWGLEDIKAISGTTADAILLPKVENEGQVHKLIDLMKKSGAPESMSVMCMMETPLGMLNAKEIAASSERISCFVMGTSDLVKDLQAQHTPERLPVITSLGLCLLAARAYGIGIVDGVCLDLNDDDAFLEACNQGLALGFDGKTLIHPKTISAANKAFGPSKEAVEKARSIVTAFEEAKKQGQGVVVLDGHLIENLHADEARRLIVYAEAINALEQGTS